MEKMKLGTETGSFTNHILSSVANGPVVGEGATILLWSDRRAFEVTWVSDDMRKCKIQRYKVKRTDNLGMSDCQTYKYDELEGDEMELVFYRGSWRSMGREIRFVKGLIDDYKSSREAHELYVSKGGQYNGAFPCTEIEGVTKEHKTYSKMNIIFGVKDEHFDYSF